MISDRILEQVSHFNFLIKDIGYDRNCDIDVKLGKFQTISGTINRIFKNKARQDTKIKFYKFMTIPILLHGCELWTTTTKTVKCRLRNGILKKT